MILPQPAELEDFIKTETGSQGKAEQIIWQVGEEDDQYDVNTAIRDVNNQANQASGLRLDWLVFRAGF